MIKSILTVGLNTPTGTLGYQFGTDLLRAIDENGTTQVGAIIVKDEIPGGMTGCDILARVKQLVNPDTKLILVTSNPGAYQEVQIPYPVWNQQDLRINLENLQL